MTSLGIFPDLQHALVAALLLAEEVGDCRRSGEQSRIRRELLHGVALAGAARTQLNKVEVTLAEWDEAREEEQL